MLVSIIMNMKRNPLTEIMTRNPITVNPDDSLHTVRELMAKHGFRHLPVVSNGELVGMISQTDVLRLSFGNVFVDESEVDETVMSLLTTEQVMISKPTSIPVSCTIGEVANLLVRVDYHAVPVVDDKQLVGMVTTTDVIKYFLENTDG